MPCSAPMRLRVSSSATAVHLLAIDRNRDAVFKTDGDFAGCVGRVGGALGQHPDVIGRGVGGVFERAALVRDVPDVAVPAVDLGGGGGDGHVVRARVLDGVLARDDGPLAPRRDHRKLRRQGLVGELEAHLVVPLSRAAVRQRVAAGLERHLDLLLGEQRAGDGGAEQVLVLVDAAGADQLPEVLRDEFLAHILDVDFRSARFAGLLFEAGEFVGALSDIAAHGHHFAAVVFLEPRNDDGGIEAPGIGESYFLGFRHKSRMQLHDSIINSSAFCACSRFSA